MNARIDIQTEWAHEAAELIQRMPDTAVNLSLVLSGLIKAVNDASWADMSEVLEFLGDAQIALSEVRAHTEEEIADWARERMQS